MKMAMRLCIILRSNTILGYFVELCKQDLTNYMKFQHNYVVF
jgi:hypothetical protein